VEIDLSFEFYILCMADVEVSEDRFEELVSRVETLELMIDDEFRSKVEEGLKDFEEDRVVSLDNYEDERDL
jgi:hypothetical protein